MAAAVAVNYSTPNFYVSEASSTSFDLSSFGSEPSVSPVSSPEFTSFDQHPLTDITDNIEVIININSFLFINVLLIVCKNKSIKLSRTFSPFFIKCVLFTYLKGPPVETRKTIC